MRDRDSGTMGMAVLAVLLAGLAAVCSAQDAQPLGGFCLIQLDQAAMVQPPAGSPALAQITLATVVLAPDQTGIAPGDRIGIWPSAEVVRYDNDPLHAVIRMETIAVRYPRSEGAIVIPGPGFGK